MGSVATTHKQKYREPFEPVMPGVVSFPSTMWRASAQAFSQDDLRDLH